MAAAFQQLPASSLSVIAHLEPRHLRLLRCQLICQLAPHGLKSRHGVSDSLKVGILQGAEDGGRARPMQPPTDMAVL